MYGVPTIQPHAAISGGSADASKDAGVPGVIVARDMRLGTPYMASFCSTTFLAA